MSQRKGGRGFNPRTTLSGSANGSLQVKNTYVNYMIQKLQMQNKKLYLNDLNCMQNNIQSIVHPDNVEYPS